MVNTIELFFTVIRKDDYVCEVEQGPFVSQELAEDVIKGKERVSPRCFREVVYVELECKFVGERNAD